MRRFLGKSCHDRGGKEGWMEVKSVAFVPPRELCSYLRTGLSGMVRWCPARLNSLSHRAASQKDLGWAAGLLSLSLFLSLSFSLSHSHDVCPLRAF